MFFSSVKYMPLADSMAVFFIYPFLILLGAAWLLREPVGKARWVLVLIGFIGALHPDFLAWGQLKEVVQNSVYVGIIAAGMAFLISMREIDLSVGSMFGLALICSALQSSTA